ncbi:Metal homeostatis protein BSD2 [Ceratocystis lukuohia]|uniref:Metal homeostatis protein BSD2 n=1 Tax=Ceratocystis lukuohia TaxID=2019550 RepID=A0ABR4MEZ3_9PEZI
MAPQQYQPVSSLLSPVSLFSFPLLTISICLQVLARDDEITHSTPTRLPSRRSTTCPSPPPSFHSRPSSPERSHAVDPDLADAFGGDSDSDSDSADEADDRQRLVRRAPTTTSISALDDDGDDGPVNSGPQTSIPETLSASAARAQPSVATLARAGRRVYGGGMASDGVFSNLAAKPDMGEEKEEMPPNALPPSLSFLTNPTLQTYEQAAADQAPPYWETTIIAPGYNGDNEVYIDGMPVGNIFGFLWNAMVSWSFQIVGFLLTYLLHSTHAAKNGSRAGLGVTLIQYGFSMKAAAIPPTPEDGNSGNSEFPTPPDPNAHNFNPSDISSSSSGWSDLTGTEWFAYILMVGGWFMLVRSVVEFLQARRHESLVLQSPERGLSVPVVATGETPDRVV